MVAGYQSGGELTTDFLVEKPHVKAETGEDDLGVGVSWNTEGTNNLDAVSLVVRENAVAINPLNWRTDETYAGVEENPGSLLEAEDGGFLRTAGVADARVHLTRGSVVCTAVAPAESAIAVQVVFGPARYHGPA